MVGDLTPQLGGDLDLNGFDITGTGGVNITGLVTATGFFGGNIIGAAGTFTGDLFVDGTLTTGELLTNFDSVGVITARKGIQVLGDGIYIVGLSTFTGDIVGVGTNTISNFNSVSATTLVGNVTGTAATFTGDVSIGGVLTYDDVTNVDSIGIVTARSGIDAQGNVNVSAGNSITTPIIYASTSLILPDGAGGTRSATAIFDEDDMASNSAIALATQQSIKAYIDARTEELVDNRLVFVRDVQTFVNSGVDTIINFNTALVSNNIPDFTYGNGVFTNTSTKTRRFIFQMQVAITATGTGYNESNLWYSINGTVTDSNRRGHVAHTHPGGSFQHMHVSTYTFTMAQNDTVRCYMWANANSYYGGKDPALSYHPFGDRNNCLVEVQEIM